MALVFFGAMAAACGGAGSSVRNERGSDGWVAVHFVEASLTSTRPGGTPWHVRRSDNGLALLGGLVGLAIGDPMLGFSMGSAASDPGGDPLAPIPYVELKIGEETYCVQPEGPTLAPRWRQPIALDTRRWSTTEEVLLLVRDAVDQGVIGQHRLRIGDLLGRRHHNLAVGDGVANLAISVTPMLPRRQSAFRVKVSGKVGQYEVTEHRDSEVMAGWLPIPVWNGDIVTITAAGKVCPSNSTDECFGPAGAEPGRWRSYNYDDFKEAPHGALVAALPGQVQVLGRSTSFRVKQSGWMLLFINDTDRSNNTGAFTVDVTVAPPR